MNNHAFTEGPWRLGPTHRDGSYAIHAKSASIVHCKPFTSSLKCAGANARLLTASPKLLHALENLLRECPRPRQEDEPLLFTAIKEAVEVVKEAHGDAIPY